jgi:enoyl-CoA hydratase
MGFETILFYKDGHTGVLQLNRPEQMNAISLRMRSEIEQVLEEASIDSEIRALILTGGEKVFCSGADIKEKPGIIQKLDENKMYRILTRRKIVHSLIEEFEKPVIAAVSGLALGGGCELALACDLRIASESAKFGLTEINFGTLPSGGGTQRLPRLVGMARAKEMIYTAVVIDAKEAYTIGLVNRVVKIESLMAEAQVLAKKIAEKSPLAIKMAKFAINKGMQVDLNSGLDYEAQCVTVLHSTEDRKEALKAFADKRKPIFKEK